MANITVCESKKWLERRDLATVSFDSCLLFAVKIQDGIILSSPAYKLNSKHHTLLFAIGKIRVDASLI